MSIPLSTASKLATRRTFLTNSLLASLAPSFVTAQTQAHTTTFTVLSLFHPTTLLVNDTTLVTLTNPNFTIDTPSTFSVEVPNKLRRTYRGTLAISSDGRYLRCIVRMDTELAVASILAAESPANAPQAYLEAQAIASRSFLHAAHTAHKGADFCDTTHCQFLREPPPTNSPYTPSTTRTANTVLQYRDADGNPQTLAAMYARSCGGRTRTLAELGLPTRGYPYYAVDCPWCLAHPEANTPTTLTTERDRLAYNRVHGWSAIPSLNGRGIGHGLGLCQLGAAAMARNGSPSAEILSHYYPNTRLS